MGLWKKKAIVANDKVVRYIKDENFKGEKRRNSRFANTSHQQTSAVTNYFQKTFRPSVTPIQKDPNNRVMPPK